MQLKESSLAEHLKWNAMLENKLQAQQAELKAIEKRNLEQARFLAIERNVADKQAKIDDLSAQYAGLMNARKTEEKLYQMEVQALQDTNSQLDAQLVKQNSEYQQKLKEQKNHLAQLQKQNITKNAQQLCILKYLDDETSQRKQQLQKARKRHKVSRTYCIELS